MRARLAESYCISGIVSSPVTGLAEEMICRDGMLLIPLLNHPKGCKYAQGELLQKFHGLSRQTLGILFMKQIQKTKNRFWEPLAGHGSNLA